MYRNSYRSSAVVCQREVSSVQRSNRFDTAATGDKLGSSILSGTPPLEELTLFMHGHSILPNNEVEVAGSRPLASKGHCAMPGRDKSSSERQSQRWMRVGSVLIGFAALVLPVTAFGAHLYSGPVSSVLLTLVFIALAIAIGLHTRFLLPSDKFCDWRTLGKWLQPFEPEFVFLVACEAGRSKAVRELFEPLKKTLRDVYASPAKLYGIQAAMLAIIIGELLCTGKIDDEHSLVTRLVSYIGTGSQVYRWSYDETGPAAEIPAESWDDLADVFDFGVWDLQHRIDDLIRRARRNA